MGSSPSPFSRGEKQMANQDGWRKALVGFPPGEYAKIKAQAEREDRTATAHIRHLARKGYEMTENTNIA